MSNITNDEKSDNYVGQIPSLIQFDELETAQGPRLHRLYYIISQSINVLTQTEVDRLLPFLLRDTIGNDRQLQLNSLKILYSIMSTQKLKVDPKMVSNTMFDLLRDSNEIKVRGSIISNLHHLFRF